VAVISYLEYSNRDMSYARDMLTLGHYDPCGRFCQQSVEKRFKHYISKNGTADNIKLMQTHNLSRLYKTVCELSKHGIIRSVLGDLYKLTTYYFETNYPSEDNIELTKEMAQEAVKICEYVNKWVDSLG